MYIDFSPEMGMQAVIQILQAFSDFFIGPFFFNWLVFSYFFLPLGSSYHGTHIFESTAVQAPCMGYWIMDNAM
jgi:hypothetical protein